MTDQLPMPESWAVFNERVRNLCALYKASETSGLRTLQRNASKGGREMSKHQISFGGWGRDLVLNEQTNETLRAALVSAARTLGLLAKDEIDHIHVQGKPIGPLRG